MISLVRFFQKNFLLLVCTVSGNLAIAQCSTTGTPTYSHTCSVEYFETIGATGSGITSTISLTGGGCGTSGTTYFDDFTTQGIVAPGGSTITINITRATGYTAYLTVYVDWANTGTYTSGDLAGTMVTMSTSTGTASYPFTVPTTGVVTGTNLHMRMMLSESTSGAPCTGTYGQTYDYYINVTSGSGCTPPVITFSPAHDTICSGGSGSPITASGAGTGGTYTWSPATGLSATTGSTVTANPTATTVYSVTGTTTASCSATYMDTVTVLTGAAPPDTVTSAGSDKICPGDSVMLDGTTGTGYKYQWFNGGVSVSGATSNTYEATAAGSYMLQITSALGCTSTSSVVSVTVYPSSIPVITFSGKVFHTGNYYTSYQWYENGTAISGATFDSVIAHSNGNYTVKVTDTNGCTETSSIYALTKLGVANIMGAAGIEIYPNPASNMIHIESPVTVKAVITGIEGKIITEQNDARDMDISYLPGGVYFIEVFDEGGHRLTVQRLVKN